MRRLVLLAVLLPLLTLTAPAEAGPKRYVALGDSFAAGPGIPMQELTACFRSTNNYAKHLAATFETELTDVTCSGAQTKHIDTVPQGLGEDGVYEEENPVQIEALSPDTDLVTLQIGGNDIGFGSIPEKCVEGQGNCRSALEADGIDAKVADVAVRVARVVTKIRERAPEADVFVLGYPAIFRHEADSEFASCPAMLASEADARYLRELQIDLNAAIEAGAAQTGAEYVDVYGPSRGHSACDLPQIRWVEPIVMADAAFVIHPNRNGMLGVGDVLSAAIKKKLATDSDLSWPEGVPAPPVVKAPQEYVRPSA